MDFKYAVCRCLLIPQFELLFFLNTKNGFTDLQNWPPYLSIFWRIRCLFVFVYMFVQDNALPPRDALFP